MDDFPADAEECVSTLLDFMDGDSTREGLKDTPSRYLRAMSFLTSGRFTDTAEVVKTFEDGSEGYQGLVFQGQIPIYSLCEHHLLPFFGVAHVGYIPSDSVIGLSKIARVANVFARRLQVQERLTTQIAACLAHHLKPRAVGVVLRCRHLCVEMRGVQKPRTLTYTLSLLGAFMTEPEARAEFMQFVRMADESLSV